MAKYEAKIHLEDQPLEDFIAAQEEPRRSECARLVEIFSEVTGWKPRLYSHGMIGWGNYAYTYATGHSGTSMATGFAPRKAELSIYIMPGYGDFGPILARLGKHKLGKSCLYLKKLSDADESALRELIAAGLKDLGTRWVIEPT